jgi:putative endonuclease
MRGGWDEFFCHSFAGRNPLNYTMPYFKTYYVYLMASKRNGTLYTGVTNNLERRIFEHKTGIASKFTKKYKVNKLVYYEETDDVSYAIQREKRIKKWKRAWKIKLIEKMNPNWDDIAKEWFE